MVTYPHPGPLPQAAGLSGEFSDLGCMSRSGAETSAILCLRDSEFGRDMRFQSSTFSQLLAPLDRRAVKAIARRHRGDAYAKLFDSWGHLVVTIFAQLSGADSLRGLEAEWNAYAQHHYHLGTGKLARSTLADASRRRPASLFAEVFGAVASLLDSGVRREGEAVVRIIDSTPIPLGKLCEGVKSNGRIRGMKVHVVFDPARDCPRVLDITDANVNDAQIGRTVAIEPGAVYCF